MSAPHSASVSGPRWMAVRPGAASPQSGRWSRSSGRAMPTRRIGAPRETSATWATRSRKVGSAQCRSSSTTTSGPRCASASKSRLTAQEVSSLVPVAAVPRPIASATRSAISPALSSPASRAAIAADGWRPGASPSPRAMSRTISASGQ